MTKRLVFAVLFGCISGIGAAGTAQAQFVPGNTGATTIYADNAVTVGNRTTLTGGVDVRQGDTRVLTDRMVIHTSGSGGLQNSDFQRVEATGNFYYLTSDNEVRGAKGVYTRADDTFVVSGGVIFKQRDGNVVTGSTLYYNVTDQSARVVGTCKGRKCGSKGRVNILIKNTPSSPSQG